jgi:hypothetical protein
MADILQELLTLLKFLPSQNHNDETKSSVGKALKQFSAHLLVEKSSILWCLFVLAYLLKNGSFCSKRGLFLTMIFSRLSSEEQRRENGEGRNSERPIF